MVFICPIHECRPSLCGSTQQSAGQLRLTRVVCRAAAAAAPIGKKLPFGGAIVTKLAGSAKIAKGEHQIVPLLGPGDGPQPRLPFGATVECFKKRIKEHIASIVQPDMAPADVTMPCSGTAHPPFPASFDAANARMLDIFYVLAGSGSVRASDGTIRHLHAGDSLVAWHNTTELRPLSPDQPPAVLKFHFPASVLMLPPGALVAPMPSHADLQIVVDECQGDTDGEVSPQDLEDMLAGVHRTSKAMEELHAEKVPGEGGEVATAVQVVGAAVAAAGGSGAAAAQGGLLNNAVPFPAVAAAAATGGVLLQRPLEEFKAFRFPRQTNKLAFVFDPAELGLSLSFGVEVFEPGHHTPLHIHKSAHELFFVLAGEGVAFCNGQRFTVRAGDCVVFPPRAVHGLDNKSDTKLYCLQLMTPNEAFVEHVKSGEPVGRLDDEDLCNLTARHC